MERRSRKQRRSIRSSLLSNKIRHSMHRARLLGSCASAVLICFGCFKEGGKPAPPPPGVTVSSVIQKDVPIQKEWVGTMVGNVDADIRPKVEGYLLTRLY